MAKLWRTCASASVLGSLLVAGTPHAAVAAAPVFSASRSAAPVVLTGANVPTWSRLAAVGVDDPVPGPITSSQGLRSAHDGLIQVPPDARDGVAPDDIAAYRWEAGSWAEVPVQVDERFPYFLVNGRSDFGIYSGTDQELTYAWGPNSSHSRGEESWKKVGGICDAEYPAADNALVTPGLGETAEDWTHAMADPVPTLDDDDEIVLDGDQAGAVAPAGTPAPGGVEGDGQVVTVTDPTSGATGAFYLFLRSGGSTFTPATSRVQLTRDANADQWIDRSFFTDDDPQKLGTSNTGYGPNLDGTVCPDGTPASAKASTDRFPRDGQVVTTPTYEETATGRWMVRGFKVTAPGTERDFGADLIDRWKGRAFQQSPDSSISVVGFEDEQVNWEANSGLLGWKQGPVRAIRETWGADSGTNVTKTEIFYAHADVFRYRLRVHPIPSDGLYTSWDYNLGVADRYYDVKTGVTGMDIPGADSPEGVKVDGVNDESIGNIDKLPVSGQPYFIDAPDPTVTTPLAVLRPEEIAARDDNGGLVYVFQVNDARGFGNPAIVPYYRDDACLDDGTGDGPIQRPWPGEASTDQRVKDGYSAANGGTPYEELVCDPANGKTPFQGAIAQHGIHFFATGDTDNVFSPVTSTELDGQQWRYAVPMSAPTNVAREYGLNVQVPFVTLATPFTGDTVPAPIVPEFPWLPVAPVIGLGVAAYVLRRRKPSAV
jgi:hypothetical protein